MSGTISVVTPIPPGCTTDDDCSYNETCINRLCRNPCNCGRNAQCHIDNHRPICSCVEGYEGNPNVACHTIGCRSDSECESGKACVNGNCVNPCLIDDPCGIHAECFVFGNKAECRCLSGYRGNPKDRCFPVGCRSNNDCPSDRSCINAQCIDPCLYDNPCSPRAECSVHNHLALCRCPVEMNGNPYVECRPEPQPECRIDADCPPTLACLDSKCQNPCSIIDPCHPPSYCQVEPTEPVRTMICICPEGYISSGSGSCKPIPPILTIGECASDSDCPADKACIRGICTDPCDCGINAECRILNHKPVCACSIGYVGNPDIECKRAGCSSDDECNGQQVCRDRVCVNVCAPENSTCGLNAECYGTNHRAICECPFGLQGNPKVACVEVDCTTESDCPSDKACVNSKCVSPCELSNPCEEPAQCKVYNHHPDCSCPIGFVGDLGSGCTRGELSFHSFVSDLS